jgi:RNA polymerase sigma factor (sigma-70 family)
MIVSLAAATLCQPAQSGHESARFMPLALACAAAAHWRAMTEQAQDAPPSTLSAPPSTLSAQLSALSENAIADAREDARSDVTDDAGDNAADDAALMLAFGAGDAAAFDVLYARHKGGTWRYLRRQLPDDALADELHQEVWMNLINARETYTADAKFSTWLYRIAHNRLIDHLRRAKVVQFSSLDAGWNDADEAGAPALVSSVSSVSASASLSDTLADTAAGPESLADSAELGRAITALVDALPAAQREAFLLQEEGGLSLSDIAQLTGAGFETVKSRLRYAYARLREGLKDYR